MPLVNKNSGDKKDKGKKLVELIRPIKISKELTVTIVLLITAIMH